MGRGMPQLFQKVSVLWDVNGSGQVWWKASVAEVDLPSKRGILGQAVLEYVAMPGYPSCLSNVEFLRGNLLRERKESRGKKNNPVSSWRLILNDEISSADISSEQDGDESFRQAEVSRRKDTHSGKRQFRSAFPEKACEQYEGSQELLDLQTKMARLQEGHASMARDLKTVQSTMESKADRRRMSAYSTQNLAAKRLLLFRLLEQLNKPPRRRGRDELPGSDDCVGVQVTRVTVDCDFGLFRDISAELCAIGEREGQSTQTEFYPPFIDTQSELLASTSFHIVIGKLKSLLQFLQVSEMSDRMAILCREASLKGESVCRLAGSYVQLGNEMCDHPSLFFFPGATSGRSTGGVRSSVTACESCGLESTLNNDGENGTGLNVVGNELRSDHHNFGFTRQTATWDMEEQRYQQPLRSDMIPAMKVGDPRSMAKGEQPKHAISFIWKKCSPTSQRRWISLASCDDLAIGTLDLLFPTIVVTGEEHCKEFTSLLSETNAFAILSD